MPDDPDGSKSPLSDPNRRFAEQRILVLHNADFGEQSDGDPAYEARADVLNQAADVARALVTRGHFVDVMGVDRDDLGDLIARLRDDPPDLVFNLVESLAQVDKNLVVAPALLELFGVPFTGAGTLTVALCVDKLRTKQILAYERIPTPRWAVIDSQFRSRVADLSTLSGLGYPLIVKLATEDGSQGISRESVVFGDDELARQLRRMREQFPGRQLMVEQYIDGRELNVAMLGNRILPITEIDMSQVPAGTPRIVTYDAKWTKDSVDYAQVSSSQLAVELSPATVDRVNQVARQAFAALSVCDFARVDLRLSADGTPYVLEVNPNCDISDGAGLARAAAAVGIAYDQLIEEVAYSARQRFAESQPISTKKSA